jgi:NADH-quinone oxidoreductase subunit J
LIVLAVTQAEVADRADIYFYIFSAIALTCSVCVITQTRAVYSALYFIVVILAVAGLLLMMGAEFLAAALIIIYGGAILVTYVFVIMLASQSGEVLYDRRSRGPLGACFAGFLLVATIGGLMSEYEPPALSSTAALSAQESGAEQSIGNTLLLGRQLMTRYVVVLELAGVLLLLAMVGAIAIARKKFPPSPDRMLEEKLIIGEKGKTAAPF